MPPPWASISDFQNFDDELANLPGDYAEPRGALLLALVNTVDTAVPVNAQPLQRANGGLAHVAGCCALRPLDYGGLSRTPPK